MSLNTTTSWGRYPSATPHNVVDLAWPSDAGVTPSNSPMLVYGLGRSYGDVCLNDGGTVFRTDRCDRMIAFDRSSGLLRAESGLSIADLLGLVVPHGWFVPVTPGTKHVTLGGAVANDVHGKNHHRVGTFGCHVTAFELIRSDGTRNLCSRTENRELFSATIGGLGLTGLITWVEIQLMPISSRTIHEESIKVSSLAEVVRVTEESDKDWDYTVSWIDVLATGPRMGKGLVLRGRFQREADSTLSTHVAKPLLNVPIEAPSWLLSRPTIKVFNTLWYLKQIRRRQQRSIDLEKFFYPLDAVGRWNLLYGKRGMLQYQCVVPFNGGVEVLRDILTVMQGGGVSSFLAVVKKFGDMRSPGILSFPRPGLTLTLDMPNTGRRLFDALDVCDDLVVQAGGRVYAAKDARIKGRVFRAMYPEINGFLPYIDPSFSSSFWRRIQSDTQGLM
ncbi:MAG: FAD-binding oxidoreductase [Candidatus Kapabacteria bacterium]|nr:FAD-binding oxidoreductase [Candidatus Kapabacteria bacterium]